MTFPIFISPNICKLYMKLLHTPNSWYPHTSGSGFRNKHHQKLLRLQSGLWTVTEESSLLTPIYSFKGEIFQDDRLWYFVFFLDYHRGDNQELPLNSIPLKPFKLNLVLDYWNALYAAKKCLFWSSTHLLRTVNTIRKLINMFFL